MGAAAVEVASGGADGAVTAGPDPCDEHCPAAFRRCRGCSFGTSAATELGSPPAAPWWATHGEEPPPVVAHAHPVGLCHASLPPYSCGGAIGQRTEPAHSRHGGTQAHGGDCERTRKPLGSVCRTSSVTNGARLGSERWGAPPPLPRGHGQRPRCAGGLDVVESRPAPVTCAGVRRPLPARTQRRKSWQPALRAC